MCSYGIWEGSTCWCFTIRKKLLETINEVEKVNLNSSVNSTRLGTRFNVCICETK